MNKSLILRITGGVAALVGLLGFARLSTFPEYFDWLPNLFSNQPVDALAFLMSWVVAPVVAIALGGLVVLFVKKIGDKLSSIALIVTSAISLLTWVTYSFILSNDLSWSLFYDRHLFTNEPSLGATLGVYSTPLMIAVLAVSIWILVAVPKPVKEFDINQPPQRKAPSGFAQFLATLVDSKLENFISRRVSGVLYIITAWLIIAAAALSELGLLFQLVSGNFFAFVAMLLVPVITLLTLIIVRMAFEAGIALIVIAENTKK